MNSLTTFEIVINFGLVVLIWMVQLIIYPSFHYYNPKKSNDMASKIYKNDCNDCNSVDVGSIRISIHSVIDNGTYLSWTKLIIILFIWGLTWMYFAPTHTKLSKGILKKDTLTQLVSLNWYRTIAWTLVFGLDFINFN